MKEAVNKSSFKEGLIKEMKLSSSDEHGILNKSVMIYLANTCSSDIIQMLRAAFIEIDKNRNGTICPEELHDFFDKDPSLQCLQDVF
jgi:Ca2+-binding EF-hand superfamily protein